MDTARLAKLILMRCLNEVLAAVLYPASSCKPKPAGPDGIRQERPHLGHALLSTRLCSGLRSCGPTCLAITRESTSATYRLNCSLFKVSWLRGLHSHVVLLIRLTVSQNRPRRSCHLVGQGYCHHVGRSSCLNLCLPSRRYLSVAHHRSRTMDQQRAQVRITSL